MGATPQSLANAASEWSRPMFCPAVMSNWAACWVPMPIRVRSVGAVCLTSDSAHRISLGVLIEFPHL